jgi:hypothetical protein
MSDLAWHLLEPVDVGAQVRQGFSTGMGMVREVQKGSALRSYLANPNDPQAASALAYFDPESAAKLEEQRAARLKALRETQDRDRAVALGELYNADPQGARQEAIAAGDFDLAEQFGKFDEASQKRSVAFWQQATPLAFKLRQIPDPEQRKALYAQARPMLEATGVDAATLNQFDPTNDTQLDAAIATGQKVSDLIEQGRVTWHQQGEQPSFATDFQGRPVGSANPYATGAPPATHPAASAVGSVLSSGGLPAPVVAGFLGNFHAEGGYGGASGDGGTASGIAQWRGDRQANFERIVGKPVGQATPEEQAKFVLWEMQNPEAAGMTVEQRDSILAAKTPGEAAELIDRLYERSSGEHRTRRIAAANQLAGVRQAVRVASKAEFDGLPSGTPFIAPDGSRRVKP